MLQQQRLYHYEKIQGTTTKICREKGRTGLYHYEKIQGTTTPRLLKRLRVCYTTTRKYRELQPRVLGRGVYRVIPLRENTGNYNT